MNRRSITTVLVLALALSAVPQAVARPRSKGSPPAKGVSFKTSFVDEQTAVTGPYGCGLNQPSVCKARFEGSATMTGKLDTFVDYFGYFWFDSATHSFTAESWDQHTGTLEGCGEGSFVMHQSNWTYDPMSFGQGTGSMHFTLEWTILKGSGTGDFTGATGSGTGDGYLEPNFANTGTYEGTILCPQGKR